MKINKIARRVAIASAGVAGAVILTASVTNDFGLGRNIEILINLMRELSVLYVDEIKPEDLLKNGAAGMTSNSSTSSSGI